MSRWIPNRVEIDPPPKECNKCIFRSVHQNHDDYSWIAWCNASDKEIPNSLIFSKKLPKWCKARRK